jgi:hypothetical protein
MKKLFTLLTLIIITRTIFAVSVTFNVDMKGQTFTNVYVVGHINSWVHTAMTDVNADSVYTVTMDLAIGDYVFYYTTLTDWSAGGREKLPTECNSLSMAYSKGGWAGDRLLVVASDPIVLNNKYSDCKGEVSTLVRNIKSVNTMVVSPNPAKEQIKVQLNQFNNAGTIGIRDISGKVILSKAILKGQISEEIDLSSLAKGIYFIEALDGKKRIVQKIIVE